jgi:uncharacterized protein (DUF1684 family)
MKANMYSIRVILLAALIVFAIVWRPVSANQASANGFVPFYQTRDTRLELSGTGVLKYLGLISIYQGALYLPSKVRADQTLDDVPKRLEVKYLRALKADEIGQAAIAGIKKNVDQQVYDRLEKRILFHNSLYQDFEPGDRVALTYVPSVGTTLEINDKTRGTIAGADFAAVLFSLWLGDKPFDTGFKKALLGERR